ncbi:hypothetical protein [Polynucleobacter sp. IMCC 29146]|uniref:hypothetical protein n=1 Tax=Polynucleobacter sp. IMCC 29146 TaxID=2780953 RepID=UPI001F46B43B|nr:hypothetical protein [Polynucleobacter sp. IMCC 29146]MCE7530178.1 hypothetical protein [Polynucleobacter sp. IMCC 29146]
MSSNRLVVGIIFSITLTALLLAYEASLLPKSIVGVYFHGIPSDVMMQTLSIQDLYEQPLKSLWYLHIQPPMFDTIRAILVSFLGSEDLLLSQYRVDTAIYFLWAIIYGLTCFLIFTIIGTQTSTIYGIFATLGFCIHPAFLLYATTLDSTLLSTFLILSLIFLLLEIGDGQKISPYLISASFLALFFTRSIFQWPWVFIIGLCLYLLKYPPQYLKKYFIICICIVALFIIKQFLLFHLTTSSSFAGLNLCRSIDACTGHYIDAKKINHADPTANSLMREFKSNNAKNFNNSIYLELNKKYLDDYKEKLFSMSAKELFAIYFNNLIIYLQPW